MRVLLETKAAWQKLAATPGQIEEHTQALAGSTCPASG
jgi:hypothetical protein